MKAGRLPRVVVTRGLLLAFLFPLTLTPLAAQTIVFSGVPSNVTVQCLSEIPSTVLGFTGVIPFGLTTNAVAGLSTGDIITVGQVSVGNWGKLNLCGFNMSSTPVFVYYMVNGMPCVVSVGDTVSPGVGNVGITPGFDDRIATNPIATVPVVDTFPNGNGQVTIQGFIIVRLLGTQGGGGNWNGTLQLLSPVMSGVTASSSCSGGVNIVYSEQQSGPSNNCYFAITRTWTATDSCNDNAIATQLVVVADTTPPSATCPPDVTVNTDPGVCTFTYTNGTVNFNASTLSVTDNCGGNVFLTNNAPSPPVFPKGTNFVMWTAIDTCGNSTGCVERVIVVDNQAPVMTCPGNILTNVSNPDGAVVTFASSAIDNCDGSVAVVCAPASGSVFGIGTTLVSCTATDSSGNVGSCTFNVTVAMDPASFRILCIAAQGNDVLLQWIMPLGFTGIVQATGGDGSGGYSDAFGDVSAPIYVPGSGLLTTNYLDAGGATNLPSRYYRVRLVP